MSKEWRPVPSKPNIMNEGWVQPSVWQWLVATVKGGHKPAPKWTWLYDDYDAGTVFITDDPQGVQTPLVQGITKEEAERIIRLLDTCADTQVK